VNVPPYIRRIVIAVVCWALVCAYLATFDPVGPAACRDCAKPAQVEIERSDATILEMER
jgi:hypothetical protein